MKRKYLTRPYQHSASGHTTTPEQWRARSLQCCTDDVQRAVLMHCPYGPFTAQQLFTYNLEIRESTRDVATLKQSLSALAEKDILTSHHHGIFVPRVEGVLFSPFRGGRLSPAEMHDAVTGRWIAVAPGYLRPNTVKLRISTNEERALYLRVADAIRAEIANDTLPAYTALPSTRNLAEAYDLDPDVVRRAYSVLLKEGLLRIETRRGVSVVPIDARQAAREKEMRALLRPGTYALCEFIRKGTLHEVPDARALATCLLDPANCGNVDAAKCDLIAALALHDLYGIPGNASTLSSLRAHIETLKVHADWYGLDGNQNVIALRQAANYAHDPKHTQGWRDRNGTLTATHPFVATTLTLLCAARPALLNRFLVELAADVVDHTTRIHSILDAMECRCQTSQCGHTSETDTCKACGCDVGYISTRQRHIVSSVFMNPYQAGAPVKLTRDPRRPTIQDFRELCHGIVTDQAREALLERFAKRGFLINAATVAGLLNAYKDVTLESKPTIMGAKPPKRNYRKKQL